MLRKMSNDLQGFEFYRSTFDTETGVLVRSVEVPDRTSQHQRWDRPTLVESLAKFKGLAVTRRQYGADDPFQKLELDWGSRFGRVTRRTEKDAKGVKIRSDYAHTHAWRHERAFSPVPETIDVKITDWCNFGCSYCYMDSTTKGKHAPRELLETIFRGLKKAPYQIAFGGGEPTAHPDFPWFLEFTKSKHTVPNYTTAGHILRDDVFEATNKFCGGVALTYHAFKGPEYFKQTYDTWRERLDKRVQLNVHVLFDQDVADNLLDLHEVGLRGLNVVLLAYYPDVGRANWESIPPKGVYEVTLPAALATVTKEAGFKIAFSEGLLPYFLSHQLPEVDTTFAGQQEGVYSCYIDNHGRMSHSSFDPPTEESRVDTSIYRVKFQKLWDKMASAPYPGHYDACDRCKYHEQCHVPNEAHFMLCKFAEHNSTMPKRVPERRKRLTVLNG